MRKLLLAALSICLLDGCEETPRSATGEPAPPVAANLRENNSRVTSGITGVDARFSYYGVYLRHVTETVDKEWHSILAQRAQVTSHKYVTIQFKLNSKGEVFEIVSIEPTAGTPEADIAACVAAVRDHSPYGPWTPEMVSKIGSQTAITFTFYYE